MSNRKQVRRIAVIAAGVLVAFAVVFAWWMSRQIVEDALDRAAAEVAQAVSTVITPQVTPEDFMTPTPALVAAWRQRVAQVVGGTDIVRIKVWNAKGTVIFSDSPDLIGRTFPLEEQEELREAIEGHLTKELSELEKSENVTEAGYGRLLEIYVPVKLAGSSQVVGVYEVYRSFEPLQAKIASLTRRVWGGSATAASLLFVSLLVVSTRSGRSR